MNDILITICGRGGSKGIPGKNIKLLNGLPLIAYTIKTAKKFLEKYDADIVISTDDINIKETAKEYGLTGDYNRPKRLARDSTGKIDVIKDVLIYYENKHNKKYQFVIDLDITSPLRTVGDLSNAFQKLIKVKEAINIFSVNPSKRNPYFNMVEESSDCFVKLVKESGKIKSRQNVPKVYDMNASFYIYKRVFFDKDYEISVTDKSLAYEIPHICFDLDEPKDFTIMEIIMKENLLDFDL